MMWLLIFFFLFTQSVGAATYYIDDNGSDSNNGSSTSLPFKTFSYAINASRAWCGDTLVVMAGTYGNTVSGSGNLLVSSVNCTFGDELVVIAQSQRQAMIKDDGTSYACRVLNSAYIIFDGLNCQSVDNPSQIGISERGTPFQVKTSNHITLRNNIAYNVNRYTNSMMYQILQSQDVLLEDNEAFKFHRHCTSGSGDRIVVRRQYCNPLGGRISGGYSEGGGGLGTADAIMSMYPCRDCVLENSIADCTTHSMFINEQNANYSNSVVVTRNYVLGNISYHCSSGNGINPNGRNVADLNHTPQDGFILNNALIDYGSRSSSILCSDCVGFTIAHNTVMGNGNGGDSTSAAHGIRTSDKTGEGVTTASMSVTITDNLVYNRPQTGFLIVGDTWTVDHNISNSNGSFSGANYNPSSDPVSGAQTFSNNATAAPGYGSCTGVWVPEGAAGKGAGTGGSDIGANILYRYKDKVLQDGTGGTTKTPLWDTVTGEFPHGAPDPEGYNRVAGAGPHDIHIRLKINTGGCSFPPGYGGSAPTDPASVVTSTDLTGAHIVTVDVGMKSLTVWVFVRWDDFLNTPAAEPLTVTSSCGGGESIPQIAPTWGTPAGDRTMKTFGKIDPASGTCTLTPTFTSANVSGWVMISRKVDDVDSYGTVAAASGQSLTPTVTAGSCTNCVFIDGLATSNVPTLSAGADQVLIAVQNHSAKVLRGATSEQAGSAGSVVSYSLSTSVGWVIQVVPLIPSGGGSGSSAVFTVTHYRCDGLLGTDGNPELTLGQLAAQDTACEVGLNGALRLRIEIAVTVSASAQTGIAPFCKKVGGSFAKVQNTFGSNYVRYYGPGIEPNIPVDGTPTTKRFAGSPFQASITKRDGSTPFLLDTIPNGTEVEIDLQLVIGNGLTNADSVQCEIWRDDGSAPIGTHSNTITIKPVTNSASIGF